MQHRDNETDSDRRRGEGADTSDPVQGHRPADAGTLASAGGGIAQASDFKLGALGVGLLALLIGAQVANQKMKGGADAS
jgi:hypothetical protein